MVMKPVTAKKAESAIDRVKAKLERVEEQIAERMNRRVALQEELARLYAGLKHESSGPAPSFNRDSVMNEHLQRLVGNFDVGAVSAKLRRDCRAALEGDSVAADDVIDALEGSASLRKIAGLS